jgi:hypothetical protein
LFEKRQKLLRVFFFFMEVKNIGKYLQKSLPVKAGVDNVAHHEIFR